MTQAQRRRAKKTKESVALLGNASFPKFCRLLKNEVTLLTSQTEQRAVNRAIKDLYDNYHDETDAHDMSQEELDRVYLKMMVYRLNNELGGDSVRLLLETIATELRRFDPS